MKQKGLLAGDKFSDAHQTIMDGARPIVAFLGRNPLVKRCLIGRIEPISRAKRRIKIRPISNGIKVMIYAGSVQDLYVYTKAPDEVAGALIKEFA